MKTRLKRERTAPCVFVYWNLVYVFFNDLSCPHFCLLTILLLDWVVLFFSLKFFLPNK